jgi:hypothetical protein
MFARPRDFWEASLLRQDFWFVFVDGTFWLKRLVHTRLHDDVWILEGMDRERRLSRKNENLASVSERI